jgi:hypothetical protein
MASRPAQFLKDTRLPVYRQSIGSAHVNLAVPTERKAMTHDDFSRTICGPDAELETLTSR